VPPGRKAGKPVVNDRPILSATGALTASSYGLAIIAGPWTRLGNVPGDGPAGSPAIHVHRRRERSGWSLNPGKTPLARRVWSLGPRIELAARLGVEPRQNESESFVLPLHHRAKKVGRRAPPVGLHHLRRWSRRWDSNPQPPVYKTGALPLSYAGEAALRLPSLTVKKQPRALPARVPGSTKTKGWWLPGDSNPEPTD
jgi:hypothetical protein